MEDPNVVRASPTKRFFISILVKDIYLIDAVIELVDNAIDAARAGLSSKALKDILIEIDFNASSFTIRDNAGGISIEQARMYAFRFGRPEDAPATPGAVGEFGVGMKRALFKMGRLFTVTSRTIQDYFKLKVDVDAWEKEKEDDPSAWRFRFEESGPNKSQQVGTEIVITRFYDYATEEFTSNNFQTRLINTLKQAHSESLAGGLQLTVNNTPVMAFGAQLLRITNDLEPIKKLQELDISGKTVLVEIVAGAGEPKLADAGWYIYCNGRLVERAEKTEKTGWNSAIDGDTTPKIHWQFRRFRGYVFFQSNNQDVLPWNTTKTSLDVEAPAYRRVRTDMITALKEVIGFLNALDGESQDEGPLTQLVTSASYTPIATLPANTNFRYNESGAKPSVKFARISYIKDPELVEKVKDHLNARSNKEAGEKTFDYYLESEKLNV